MKRIIKNKVYDTNTAQRLAENGYNYPGDLNFWNETLYRKRTGEYFLHCEGGANSRYAERIDANSWSGGERITPVTEEEAREWAERNLDGDQYEEIFEPVVDEEPEAGKQLMTVYINKRYAEIIKAEARRLGMSQGDYIEAMIRESTKVD